jgi:hypothetical protein
MTRDLTRTTTFPGSIHYVEGETVFASIGNTVYCSLDGGGEWAKLFSFPLRLIERLKCGTRITRRLFRCGVRHLIRIDENTVVCWAFGGVFRYDLPQKRLTRSAAVFPGSRPLNICHAGGGTLFVGEYRSNPERSAVHVFTSSDSGLTWSVAWEFDSVRHIHGVHHDPYTGHIWIATGDEDNECGIWVTTDRFKTVRLITGGTQQARAIQLIFTEDHVYFGSDTPYEQNWLYRLRRQDLQIERLQPVDGSVFYGCKVGNRLFFSTVCEPSKVNLSREAAVWESCDGTNWRPLVKFRKDFLPFKLFKYGQIRFPEGSGRHDTLWITPLATANDQRSIKLTLTAPGGDSVLP